MDPTPKLNPNIDQEQKEKHELEAIPIFRDNELYAEMFPEIKPTLEKGEKPTVKKILDAIIQHTGRKIILDRTCADEIQGIKIDSISLEDFPKELELKGVPVLPNYDEYVDSNKIFQLLKDKFKTELISEGDYLYTIDEKVSKILGGTFSPELVKSLFEIAKEKNKNIKQVYILTDNIKDHIYTEDPKEIEETVIPTLIAQAKEDFGLEPIVLPTMGIFDIKDGDHIIVDRHNLIVREGIVKQKPTQFSVLPMETEISNNERYLQEKTDKSKLVTILRKEFEKK